MLQFHQVPCSIRESSFNSNSKNISHKIFCIIYVTHNERDRTKTLEDVADVLT